MELVGITIDFSMQVTYKLLRLLVRVGFVDTVSSLSIRYEIIAERAGEERRSINTVHQVAE